MPTDDLAVIWVAHEYPDRPFAYGMWLCDCTACVAVLKADVARRPDRVFVVKWARSPRLMTTGAVLLDAMEHPGSVEHLVDDPDDWAREVFVADEARSSSRRRRRAA